MPIHNLIFEYYTFTCTDPVPVFFNCGCIFGSRLGNYIELNTSATCVSEQNYTVDIFLADKNYVYVVFTHLV